MRITIEIGRPTRRRVVAAFLVAGLLVVPGAAQASHIFNDVPANHTFHGDVSAIALAGITVGCGGGKFCPDAGITRAQEAAFLHRGLGRVADDYGLSMTLPPDTPVAVAATTITAGAATGAIPGANGFLLVNGHASAFSGTADLCDCIVTIRIWIDGVLQDGAAEVELQASSADQREASGLTIAVPISSGLHTVELVTEEVVGSENLAISGSLTVLYVPFGATGTDAP